MSNRVVARAGVFVGQVVAAQCSRRLEKSNKIACVNCID